MTSVLLIRPLCEGDEPEFAEPLGIERLAGYLRERGAHDVRVFDRRLYAAERRAGLTGPDAPGFYDEVRAAFEGTAGPSIIGLSLMTSADVPDARRVISRLGARWPDALFVVGGMFVTTAPEAAARQLPEHTVLLRGEGEVQLFELVQDDALREKSFKRSSVRHSESEAINLEHCVYADNRFAGILRSVQDDRSVHPFGRNAGVKPQALTSNRIFAKACCDETFGSQPASPDDWAIPYRPHLERYGRLRCAVSVQASRGCCGACAFCATPTLPRELRRWSGRDEALVIDEVQAVAERLAAAGLPPVFNFVDDDFGSLERLESLAAGFSARGLQIAFACEMRFASLVREPHLAERLARLHAAGLTRVFFGVESLDEATRSRWKKPIDVRALPEVLGCFRAAGVDVQVGYILWHGTQTPANAACEVDRLRDLGLYSHRVAISRLIVFPGCDLAQLEHGRDAAAVAVANAEGFEPMCADAESFYQRFSLAAAELTREWTQLAIVEPYAAAEAFLSGDAAEVKSLRERLADVNDRSYRLFKEMAS